MGSEFFKQVNDAKIEVDYAAFRELIVFHPARPGRLCSPWVFSCKEKRYVIALVYSCR